MARFINWNNFVANQNEEYPGRPDRIIAIEYGKRLAEYVKQQGGGENEAESLLNNVSSDVLTEGGTLKGLVKSSYNDRNRQIEDKIIGEKGIVSGVTAEEKKASEKRPIIQQYPEFYFCGCDVRISFGKEYIDDLVTLDYTLTNNKSPIYGYASAKFDAVAAGTEIVQGNFSIMLRSPMGHRAGNHYLSQILNATSPDKRSYLESGTAGSRIGEGFTIRMVYSTAFEKDGDTTPETWANYVITEIRNVHITTSSRVANPSGEPIAEIYSFFGKEVIEDTL